MRLSFVKPWAPRCIMGLLGLAFSMVILWDCLIRLNFAKLSHSSTHGPPGSGLFHGNLMRLTHEIELCAAISLPSPHGPPGSGLCHGNLMRLSHEIELCKAISFSSPHGPPGPGLRHGNCSRLSHEIKLCKTTPRPMGLLLAWPLPR